MSQFFKACQYTKIQRKPTATQVQGYKHGQD